MVHEERVALKYIKEEVRDTNVCEGEVRLPRLQRVFPIPKGGVDTMACRPDDVLLADQELFCSLVK